MNKGNILKQEQKVAHCKRTLLRLPLSFRTLYSCTLHQSLELFISVQVPFFAKEARPKDQISEEESGCANMQGSRGVGNYRVC